MRNTGLRKNRQRGFVLNLEYMLFIAILVMGLLVGWVTLRDSLNAELIDTANAIEGSITFYYFNDPDRGLGPAFVDLTTEFCEPGAEEGLGLDAGNTCGATGNTPPVE